MADADLGQGTFAAIENGSGDGQGTSEPGQGTILLEAGPLAENTDRNTTNLSPPWRPGQSGNPGGRPKGVGAYIREQTKDGREMVDFALAVMRGRRKAPIKQRLEALYWLSDRAFGRSPLPLPELPEGTEKLTIREIVVELVGDGRD